MSMSCNTKSPLVLETHEVDFLNKTGDIINAKELNLDVPGVRDVVVCDTLLCFLTKDPSGMLKIYKKNTLEYMASFCQLGRAKNEFTGQVNLTNGQYYQRNGDLIIPLMDNNSLLQKEVNVSASLRTGHTVVEGIEPRTANEYSFVLLDNGLEKTFSFRNPYLNAETGIMELPLYAIREHNEIVREYKVFKKHVATENIENLELWYSGNLLKHPSRSLVIFPMCNLDDILFFDLKTNHHYSLHQTGSTSASDICVFNDQRKNRSCFGRPVADKASDYFYVTYFGGKYTEEAVNENTMRAELLVFDWDGNYKGGVKLDTNYHRHSLDSDTKILYAVNIGSEKIYTFDLSGLINTIAK